MQNNRMHAFTDDLTHAQLVDLLKYLNACNDATYANIKKWRRDNNLPVDWMD